jgi:hypothetical protein
MVYRHAMFSLKSLAIKHELGSLIDYLRFFNECQRMSANYIRFTND